MPNPIITNPLGVFGSENNIVYVDKDSFPVASDPAGNTNTITGITTANPGVVTTTTAHGLVTGQSVTIAGVVGATQANGTWKITRLSATTFSIPVNVTGTWSSGGTTTAAFSIGQLVQWQGWNGTVSSCTAATAYPTVTLSATTGDALLAGVIVGGNQAGSTPLLGGRLTVVARGIAPVLCDATTAIGNTLIQSAASPGIAKPGTAASSLNVGVALAVATYVSPNPILCTSYIRLS